MFDVVVIGGGTAGVAAAYTLSVNGLKTLLIEKKDYLGGEMTGGLVVPMMNTGASLINQDFFNLMVAEMSKIGAQIEFQGNKGWFNPHALKVVLNDILEKAGVKIMYNTTVSGFVASNDRKILSITASGQNSNKYRLSEYNNMIHSDNKLAEKSKILLEHIETIYVIDATGNCDFGKLCNCNFLENKSGENQLVSLRFCMRGVDIHKFGEFLREYDSDTDVTPIEIINGKMHLSTAFTWDKQDKWGLFPLFQKAVTAGDLTVEDCNYFQLFTVAGVDDEIAFNCPRYPEIIDIYDDKVVSDTYKWLNDSIIRIAGFCKKYFKGFENAYISQVADGIGIRCSRRIKGKYVYTEEDLKGSKTFDNPVLESNYPIDVHKTGKDSGVEMVYKSYQLPVESLMSADFDNLFVAGRCLSADFKAQSALRVQKSCLSMGEGVAKYIVKQIKG